MDTLKQRGHKVTIISRTQAPGRITWVRVHSLYSFITEKQALLFLNTEDYCNSLPVQNDILKSPLPECEAVVNLAGENILNPLKR